MYVCMYLLCMYLRKQYFLVLYMILMVYVLVEAAGVRRGTTAQDQDFQGGGHSASRPRRAGPPGTVTSIHTYIVFPF